MGGVIEQPGRSGVRNTAGGRQSSFFQISQLISIRRRYIITQSIAVSNQKGNLMKLATAVIASMFVTVAFAQAPAAKKEEAKPAAAAPAPAKDAKKDAPKSDAKKDDKKAQAAKK